jgi:hypothetical protein
MSTTTTFHCRNCHQFIRSEESKKIIK